jgi:hypothetical protein
LILGKFDEGKAEERNTLIIKMHRSGLAIEQIARIAELSQNEVKKISTAAKRYRRNRLR